MAETELFVVRSNFYLFNVVISSKGSKMVKAVETKEEFLAELAAAGDKAVIVDFFATWCGPCKMIAPKIANWEQTYQNVVVLKVDVDENEETAAENEISAMPTFMVFKNGVKIDSLVGADAEKVEGLFKKYN